jgi:prepilin-type N-terminal cleavage/methylation domain-containing protein
MTKLRMTHAIGFAAALAQRGSGARGCRRGLSLLEIIAVVTVLGILAVLIVPRFTTQSLSARRTGCSVNRNNIQIQCQLWRRQQGASPAANLSDIGSDPSYFPEGLPTCPVDGSAYTINTATQTVVGHNHP